MLGALKSCSCSAAEGAVSLSKLCVGSGAISPVAAQGWPWTFGPVSAPGAPSTEGGEVAQEMDRASWLEPHGKNAVAGGQDLKKQDRIHTARDNNLHHQHRHWGRRARSQTSCAVDPCLATESPDQAVLVLPRSGSLGLETRREKKRVGPLVLGDLSPSGRHTRVSQGAGVDGM